jgi:hypothetical protein
VAHEIEPEEEPGYRYDDRRQDIKRGQAEIAALVEQGRVEREGRKGRVAAEYAGGQEQPPML